MKIHHTKIRVWALLLTCASFTSAQAGTGMLGVVHNFGGSTGFTFKLLSTDSPNRGAAVLGLSYFPKKSEQRWGLDLGVGYNFSKATLTLSYDLLNTQAQIGLGASTTHDPTPPAPALAPPVAPPVCVPPLVPSEFGCVGE